MTSGHDQPLTRRQLRELERQQAEQADGTAAAGPVATSAIPLAPSVPVAPADEAEAQSAEPEPEPAAVDDATTVGDVTERTLSRRELREIIELPAEEETEAEAAVEAEAEAEAEVEAEAEADDDGMALADEAKDTVAPPPAHWVDSEQHVDAIDISEPFDEILARGITSAGPATTTSALIMPEMISPTTGPVPITGEILVTGSIDLPRSLGATGQHPNHFESADVDKLFDGLDDAAEVADVAPVKASRAVSSHASTRGVMAPPSKSGGNLLTVLAITAGVLALAVIGLFIAGFVFNAF